MRWLLTFVVGTLVGWFILRGSLSMIGWDVGGWAIGLLVMLVAQTAIWAASEFLFSE